MDKKSVSFIILNTKSKLEVSFKNHPDANPKSRKNHLQRFAMNPAAYWGPGTRATAMYEFFVFIINMKKQNKIKI